MSLVWSLINLLQADESRDRVHRGYEIDQTGQMVSVTPGSASYVRPSRCAAGQELSLRAQADVYATIAKVSSSLHDGYLRC